ncbi:MAG: DUF2203 domain-containing protein [Carbonactinosporaceae bacterium]
MDPTFTLEQAREMLPDVRRHAGDLIVVRADLVELTGAIRMERPSPIGGVPEAKALEARLHDILEWFTTEGIEVKGFAPLIVDFPSELAGDPVLLCWLEGETELEWYHRAEHGFMGRRRLPED